MKVHASHILISAFITNGPKVIIPLFSDAVIVSLTLQVALATFTTYLLVSPDNILDVEKAFVSISLFNIMRIPICRLPILVSDIIQVWSWWMWTLSGDLIIMQAFVCQWSIVQLVFLSLLSLLFIVFEKAFSKKLLFSTTRVWYTNRLEYTWVRPRWLVYAQGSCVQY